MVLKAPLAGIAGTLLVLIYRWYTGTFCTSYTSSRVTTIGTSSGVTIDTETNDGYKMDWSFRRAERLQT